MTLRTVILLYFSETDTVRSNESDRTLSRSQVDNEEMTHSHSSEEGQPPPHPHFKRDKWATIRGGPSSWSEWTIRLEDIERKERIVTRGEFCNNEVQRGYWHQDVAVKFLSMDHVEDEKQLETFKREVGAGRE